MGNIISTNQTTWPQCSTFARLILKVVC